MNYLRILGYLLISQLTMGFRISSGPFTSEHSQHYITKEQWKTIDNLLTNQHPQPLSPVHEMKIRNIIYQYYYNWAYYKAYCFKRFHKHKCRGITIEEMVMYSQSGLYQATRKYNGKSKFVSYAQKYVLGELYRCMTELHPITNVPKHIRRRKVQPMADSIFEQNIKPNTRYNAKYNKQLNTKFMGENEWMIDKFSSKYSTVKSDTILTDYLETENQNTKYRILLQKLSELDWTTQNIFYMKYGNLIQNQGKEKSNREIGEQIGFSEEFVRKKIEIAKKHISSPFLLCL